jgi:diguanylate cyclase (GGDEF)-like protein/PAS domain S-box-containing protein
VILSLYLHMRRSVAPIDKPVAVLLVVLIIDAFRTLFESIYFGFYFNSQYGFLPASIEALLGQPQFLVIPKLINIIAGLVVLFILIRRWFPATLRERHETLERLSRAAEVFTHAQEGIVIVSEDGTVTDANAGFLALSGYSEDEVIGAGFEMHQSGRHGAAFYQSMWQSIKQSGTWNGQIWNRRKNGDLYPCNLRITALRNDEGELTGYVGLYTDLSAYFEQQEQLTAITHYDPLTELPNRVMLTDRLKQALRRSDRGGTGVAVLFLDLDDFKAINEAHGAECGDAALRAVAAALLGELRAYDTLARFGGDEFVIVLPEVADAADVGLTTGRLVEAVARPLTIDGNVLQLAVSVGATLYPSDRGDPDQLIRHASQAMYDAKQSPETQFQLYDARQQQMFEELALLRQDVHRALLDGEFVLHYQPIVALQSRAVVGIEALLRWQRGEELLLPGEFLEATRGHALAEELGEWVIARVLAQLSDWRDLGLVIRTSINIDPFHLQQAHFAERLAVLLAKQADVDAQQLELEVLETSALGDVESARSTMDQCLTIGVSFAIDDFGTGYSSLTYLRRLPAERVKIDQSFVCDMLNDEDDHAMVTNVIAMAHTLGRTVIAEGAETPAHLDALSALGCDLAQGFGIAKPMPADEFVQWHNEFQGPSGEPESKRQAGHTVP